MTKTKIVDLDQFDAVRESESGYEFELKQTDGLTGTGIFLSILGAHADVVKKWTGKIVNKSIRDQQIAQRKGKPVDPKSLDDIDAQNIEGAALRVTGWHNVKQEFSQELLKTHLGRNPHWVDQIIEESNNLGNFTKAQ